MEKTIRSMEEFERTYFPKKHRAITPEEKLSRLSKRLGAKLGRYVGKLIRDAIEQGGESPEKFTTYSGSTSRPF